MHRTKMHKTFSSVYWTNLTTEQALSVFEVELDKSGRKKFCTIQRAVTFYTTTFFSYLILVKWNYISVELYKPCLYKLILRVVPTKAIKSD